MENLKLLSGPILLSKTCALVKEERRITREILECLREIEARKLYLEMGYPNLWEFTVKHLGYSEGAAQRRISAMRLMKEIPEIAPAIESGRLSLGNLAQAQRVVKNHPEAVLDKKAFVLSLENLSSRECEKRILALVPESERKEDRERPVSQKWTEIKFCADTRLVEKLEKIRKLASHKGHLKSDYNDLFHFLSDLALKKLDPEIKPTRKLDSPPAPAVNENSASANETKDTDAYARSPRSRYIPAQARKEIWSRAHGQCEFRSASGVRCSARAFLQIDHVTPYALGGTSDMENLRVLCSAHNIHAAAEIFGRGHMEKFARGS